MNISYTSRLTYNIYSFIHMQNVILEYFNCIKKTENKNTAHMMHMTSLFKNSQQTSFSLKMFQE